MHLSDRLFGRFCSSLVALSLMATIPWLAVAWGSTAQAQKADVEWLQKRSEKAAALFLDGQSEHEQGAYNAALSIYDEVLRLDPIHIKAYASRAGVLGALEDYEGAIADYTAAINLNPSLAGAYGGRGFAYYLKGNQIKAAKDLAKAADLFKQAGDMESYFGTIKLLKELSTSS